MKLATPIIGIVRGVGGTFFQELMTASFAAGLHALEITLNTPRAEEILATCRPLVPEGKLLGMGTIRTKQEAERAVAAGAMFLVTPNLDLEVIHFAKSTGVPVIAGALTPTEVFSAWQAGADLIKIFPCRALGGPRYIRDLLGPFDGAPLVAVGGVNAANASEYLAAGAQAVGVGPALFGEAALAAEDPDAVRTNVQAFLANCTQTPPS